MFVFQTGLRPRNPVLRLIGSILGLFVVLGVLALGFFAFLALLAGGALWMLVRMLRGATRPRAAKPATTGESGIIDGEFTVVRDAPARAALEHPAASVHGRSG
jgi:hypothetical protein